MILTGLAVKKSGHEYLVSPTAQGPYLAASLVQHVSGECISEPFAGSHAIAKEASLPRADLAVLAQYGTLGRTLTDTATRRRTRRMIWLAMPTSWTATDTYRDAENEVASASCNFAIGC